MSQPEETNQTTARPETQPFAKRHYSKPGFRFERVFETRALTCGKTQTQGNCSAFNRKTS
jgi:hypothetical protein